MTNQVFGFFPLYILNPMNDIMTLRDGLHEQLTKLEALTDLGLSDDFLDYPKSTLYHYLSTLNNFTKNIHELVDAIEKKQSN